MAESFAFSVLAVTVTSHFAVSHFLGLGLGLGLGLWVSVRVMGIVTVYFDVPVGYPQPCAYRIR